MFAEPQIISCAACQGYTTIQKYTPVFLRGEPGMVLTTSLYANFMKVILQTKVVGLLCEDCGEDVLSHYEYQ